MVVSLYRCSIVFIIDKTTGVAYEAFVLSITASQDSVMHTSLDSFLINYHPYPDKKMGELSPE